MKIEKLPSGSYRIRKMYKGIRYTVTIDHKPTQKEAMQLMSAELDKIQAKKERMTFKAAAENYIELKENVLSPTTIRAYNTIVRNLSGKFIQLPVNDITSVEVQKEINSYSKNRSPKTVSNAHGFISAVLGMFCPNTILNTTLPQKVRNEAYIPTDNDVKNILKYAKGSDYEISLMLALFGLRRSEICALTLDDISGNILTINKAKVQSKDGKWVIKTTKTDAGTRKIFLPDEIIDLISKNGKIYSGHPNNILKYLQKAQSDLGIPKFSLHKLRHYYASVSHSLGIPDQYIMSSGGWKSNSTLKTVYQHAMQDKKEEMQKFTGEYLKEIIFYD